jgi:sialate O-acetylesterase
MKHFAKTMLAAAAITLGVMQPAAAKVTLPSFFTDNMVLQQKTTANLWGKSDKPSVKITTSWDGRTYTAKPGTDGSWTAGLKTPSFGGPYTIMIDDGDKTTLNNILIGEVWLCSGQSNMEMPLDGWGKVSNYEQEIQNANYPQIRIIQAEHADSAVPLNDLKVHHGGWQVCSPQTIADFSSTAYFFARKIYQETHIPIGLVHSSWSGTLVEAWTSSEALKTTHDFDAALESMASDASREAMQKKYDADMKIWTAALEKADKGIVGKWTSADVNDTAWKTITVPSFWENKGLPDFDGVVWYRKTVLLPEDFNGQDIQLQYYADDDDKLYVNGNYIGSTVGYNVLRNYTIPAKAWKQGENVIAIRIFDGAVGGGLYGPDNLSLKVNGKSVSLAGEWKYAEGVNLHDLPAMPYIPQGQNRPSALFNAMIHPLLKFSFGGVIWYQGEANEYRAHQYQTLFPLLINDWRRQFNNKNLPFYYAQLANFRQSKAQPAPSEWAEVREAQMMALKLPNTGMAVITDIGNPDDIHPKNKQDVGGRLALIALAKTYGIKLPYSGPMYASYKKSGNAITISFTDNKDIKAANDAALKGFSIAGADKVFYWADAKIENGRVVVSSSKVANPEAVRYNWADNPDGNLTNASGLPASSFRTDDWPGITFGKK